MVSRPGRGKAYKKAGIAEVTYNDLRGTAAPRLGLVGCTEAEIATITGHALRDVRWIPCDTHILHRDQAFAESAIRKLEMGHAWGPKKERFWASAAKWTAKRSTKSNNKKGESLAGSNGWGTRIRT